jgi:hypothetical protein
MSRVCYSTQSDFIEEISIKSFFFHQRQAINPTLNQEKMASFQMEQKKIIWFDYAKYEDKT